MGCACKSKKSYEVTEGAKGTAGKKVPKSTELEAKAHARRTGGSYRIVSK